MQHFLLLISCVFLTTACAPVETPPTKTPVPATSNAYSEEERLWDAPEISGSPMSSPTDSFSNDSMTPSPASVPAGFSQTAEPQAGETVATIKTNLGDIKIRLFSSIVPKTVENFVTLAQKDYYDGVIFHRVIPDFMIQGGDPEGTGMGGESAWGAKFDDEFNAALSNIRGSISMANSGPNTNGSQFFINQKDNIFLDFNKPPLTSGHAVFGQVYDGLDILDAIAAVKTGAGDKPLEDVVIEDIMIEQFQ